MAMARSLPTLLLLAALSGPALAGSASAGVKVTPVQKVIGMLNDMMAKGKKEKHEEQVTFSTYQAFCAATEKEKTTAITKGKETIEKLEADIAKAAEDIIVTQKAIAQHDADLASWSEEKAAAAEQRAKEDADFQVEYKDYSEALDACERTVTTLKSGSDISFVQAKEHLQKLSTLEVVPLSARRVLGSFLQESTNDKALAAIASESKVGAPEAATFESQSGGVLQIVEDMGEKFEEKRDTREKEEMKKKFAFQSLDQELHNSIKEAEAERGEKEARVSDIKEAQAQAESDLGSTKADLATDEQFLKDLLLECDAKAKDYESRQTLRKGEIDSIAKAIEIMSGEAVSGGTQHLPSLVQATALAQLRSSSGSISPLQRNVAAFLAEKARTIQSKLLALVASHAEADPFKKITGMIKAMIEKLMQEANDEAEHKGFCDTEMGTNEQTRNRKTEEVEELTSKSEKLTADITKLGEEISALGDEISAIDAAVTKATTERTDEKLKNTQTIADAKAAAAATAKALGVLKDFYEGAAEATALAQFRSGSAVPGAPETFDKPYTGMGASSGGIVGMLEVILSDFERLDAETTAGEAAAEGAYSKFMTDSKKDKAVKTADMNSKTATKTEFESDLGETKKDLKTTQEELSAAMAYYEKLKPSCVDVAESYEDRVMRRKEEIESLTEALKILNESPP